MAKGASPKPSPARFALANNLRHYMGEFRKGHIKGLSSRELAAQMTAAGGDVISYKTVDRLLNPYDETAKSPRLETIDALASFFEVDSWEMLKPRSSKEAISGLERQISEGNSSATQQRTKSKK